MRFRELPGFPSLFVDFLARAGRAAEFFPYRPDAETLRARAPLAAAPIRSRQDLCDALREQAGQFGSAGPTVANIERLRSPDCVVVAATLRPGILGGPLSSYLKAMTAARLAAWLSERGLPAIPVGWIDRVLEPADLCAGVLSPQGPVRVDLGAALDSASGLPDSIGEFLGRVTALVGDSPSESDMLRLLESTYLPGARTSVAWGRAFSSMLGSCGIVLFDLHQSDLADWKRTTSLMQRGVDLKALLTKEENRLDEAGYGAQAESIIAFAGRRQASKNDIGAELHFFMQSLFLPVAAFVIDESEIFAAAREQRIFSEEKRLAPILWPRTSATLVDQRSRKLLVRYDLGIERLFAGPQRLADYLMKTSAELDPRSRVSAMKAAVEGKLADLAGMVPAGDRLGKSIDDSRRRMVHQIGKLARSFSEAQQRRRQIADRHAGYLCDHLAPWGGLQERELAGWQFISASSDRLYQSIDPWRFEHQIIYL